jgi:hypothetical protein
MNKIRVIDEIMGSGKTTRAIERMKYYLKSGTKFIYVTPYLKETERIQEALGSEKVFTPDNNHCDVNQELMGNEDDFYIDTFFTHLTKRGHFLKMVLEGKNIATTHSLFTSLDVNDYKVFKDYILILDEVIDPIKIVNFGKQDILIMNESNLISVDNDSKVTFLKDDYTDKAFREVQEMCRNSDVHFLDGYFFVWVFPIEIFKSFKEIQILTYLFEASFISAYFKLYEIEYNIERLDDSEKRKEIKKLLNIYFGSANDTGKHKSALSLSWYNSRSNAQLKSLSKATSNIFTRVFKTKSNNNGYTTFKKYESKIKGGGYSKGFVVLNSRATNEYASIHSMAYLVNRFHTPQSVNFFKYRGVELNQELWALSEMIQWIWRGSIRNNEPMNLYIPSKRMRELLLDWLNNEEK